MNVFPMNVQKNLCICANDNKRDHIHYTLDNKNNLSVIIQNLALHKIYITLYFFNRFDFSKFR